MNLAKEDVTNYWIGVFTVEKKKFVNYQVRILMVLMFAFLEQRAYLDSGKADPFMFVIAQISREYNGFARLSWP